VSAVEHKIRWFVTPDGSTWLPRESGMRGTWGYDAECSCGWKSRTGGAVERFVRERVREHKWDVANGYWKPEENR
jgi:hypothetical protein